MTTGSPPRFSEEELEACKNWLLPDVSSKKTISSVEKKILDKQQHVKKEKAHVNAKMAPVEGESIEMIEDLVTALTAEQLQEITEAAEKEGFDAGYETGLKQGMEAGKKKGYSDGYQEGLSAAKQQVVDQCEQLKHIVDALLIPLEAEQNQLQDTLLNMVAELTGAVVLRELQLDSSHITQLVDDALKTVPVGADKFSLYLNNQDIALVEEHLERFQDHHEKKMKLYVDDVLLPGGCRLETKQTIVDYTVEKRLQKVIDGFLHKRFVDQESVDAATEELMLSTSEAESVLSSSMGNNSTTSPPEKPVENSEGEVGETSDSNNIPNDSHREGDG